MDDSRAGRQAALLTALAHPTRLAILSALLGHQRCVSDLNKLMPRVSQVNLSQHLSVLRRAGLVRSARQGAKRCYSVTDRRTVRAILRSLDGAAGPAAASGTDGRAGRGRDAASA